MSFYIDRQFLLIISSRLEGFSQKKEDLWNCRCKICNDSQKKKSKKRGFFYRKNDNLFYRCFNCGYSTNFFNFLKEIDPSLAKEYSLEVFKDKKNWDGSFKKQETFKYNPKKPSFSSKENEINEIPIPSIALLSEDNIAKQYVLNRKIPKGMYKDLYYAEDFKNFVHLISPDNSKNLIENDQRLIIPFRDRNKKLIGFQGRSLTENKIRYITIKLEENSLKIFGLDKVNYKEKIMVVEGPLDAMFLANAIATMDSNLTLSEFLGKNNVILVYDNEPRNPQIVKQIKKSIDLGFDVCLFPEFFHAKDINEAVIKGFTKPEIQRIIDTHTYKGIRATLEFNKWKKC